MKYIYLTVFLLGTSFIVVSYWVGQHSMTTSHNKEAVTSTAIDYHDEVIPNNEIQAPEVKQKTNIDYSQVETQGTHILIPNENIIETGTEEQYLDKVISNGPLFAGEENVKMPIPELTHDANVIDELNGNNYNTAEDYDDYYSSFLSSIDPISAIEAEEFVEEYINYDALIPEEVSNLARLYQKVNPEERAAFLEYLEPILNETFDSYEINEVNGGSYNIVEYFDYNDDYFPFLSSNEPVSAIEAEEYIEEYINYGTFNSEKVSNLARLYQKVNPEEQDAFLEYLTLMLNETLGLQTPELEE